MAKKWIAAGLVGLAIPEQHGGMEVEDYRFRMVISEELARVGAASVNATFGVHDDIVLAYLLDLGTPEQLERWLPPMASGDSIGAIGMTEPAAGSVRANTSTLSAWKPFVMKVFEPFSTQSSPSRTAFVRMPCRSLPASGSVMPIAPIEVPAAIGGSHCSSCSGVPRSSR